MDWITVTRGFINFVPITPSKLKHLNEKSLNIFASAWFNHQCIIRKCVSTVHRGSTCIQFFLDLPAQENK